MKTLHIVVICIFFSAFCFSQSDYKTYINNKNEIDPVYIDNALRDLYNKTIFSNAKIETYTKTVTTSFENLTTITSGQAALIFWCGFNTFRGTTLCTYDSAIGTPFNDDRFFADTGGATFQYSNGYVQFRANTNRTNTHITVIKY